ncbi:MAG: phosphatidate cytidylyltransferase [Planctomycetaceae bacterium]|nr:phosphatidate cytidylyltransferase [Planctomycetaceae bacterium]
MLRWRLLLGTLIIAAMAWLCWLDAHAATPGVWLLPLAILAAMLGTSETLRLLDAAGMRPARWAAYVGNLLLVFSGWERLAEGSRPAWDVAAMAAAVFAVFVAEMWRYRKPGESLANIAGGIFALVYVGVMLRFAIWLRLEYGIGALAAWIIVVKMGDTGAYTVGRLIGRHKMAPLISPGKTIEGALGAFLFACVGSWFAFRWIVAAGASVMAPWYGWVLFGLLVGGAGLVGDLAESLLKRDAGVKDSSTWMPGFGGALDILDSLLLSAPVAWFCFASGLVGR